MQAKPFQDPALARTVAAIVIRGLRKEFGDIVAVAGVSLTIPRGQVFGLLGPNGAGKTTLLRILMGRAEATAGSATVLGHDVRTEMSLVKRVIGVVPQDDPFDRDLTVVQNLVYHSELFGFHPDYYEPRIAELLEFTHLTARKDSQVGELSGGLKRRLTVARSLLNDPEVLLLDEPTTGLDPQSRRVLWGRINELREQGRTMILTTHYMDEADFLCDRIAIIDEGRILAEGTPLELKARYGGVAHVRFTLASDQEAILAKLKAAGHEVKVERGHFEVETSAKTAFLKLLLDVTGAALKELEIREPDLEDVFLNLTGRDLRE